MTTIRNVGQLADDSDVAMTAAVIAAIGALPAAGVRGSRSMTTGSYRIFNSGGWRSATSADRSDPPVDLCVLPINGGDATVQSTAPADV